VPAFNRTYGRPNFGNDVKPVALLERSKEWIYKSLEDWNEEIGG